MQWRSKVGNVEVCLNLWDIPGQEKYRSVNKLHYRGSYGAVIVFDLVDSESLWSVREWIRQCKVYCGDIPKLVLGNKLDLLE